MAYPQKIEGSWVYEELRRVRNFRPAFAKLGLWGGMLFGGAELKLLGGRAPWTLRHHHADHGAEDPATVAMTMGLLALGTFTYGAMLNRTAGREPDDPRLLEAAADMYADWFRRDEEDA